MLAKFRELFGGKKEVQQPTYAIPPTSDDTVNESRYLTYLTTDKPIYKPGETVYLRGVILHGLTRKPCSLSLSQSPLLQIISPSGEKVFDTAIAIPQDSTISANWKIPEEQNGGDYKARIYYKYNQDFATCEREFNIRAFRAPRLKTQLKFLEKGYGTGQEATALLEVTRAEGGVPEDADIEAIARVDGNEVFRKNFKLNKDGSVIIKFKLPSKIETGDGNLVCSITDGGVVESASKTIPILLQSMDVRIYPEGGDLIGGIENTFYVEAFTRTGDPADITAEIIEASGHVEGAISTDHEGRGKSSFTPKAGKQYALKIVKPTGIINQIPFPEVHEKGVALHSTHDTFQHGTPLSIQVTSTESANYTVSMFKVDGLISSQEISLKAREKQSVNLEAKHFDGVLRVTVLRESVPQAERLVFVHPKGNLSIDIEPNKQTYVPTETSKVKIVVKDNQGNPVKQAYVGVTVVDDSVLEMVEKRKQAPRLPSMVLLESDVDHLEDASFYFNPKEPKANLAIDLLLGTQGWRRFVIGNQTKIEELLQDDKTKFKIERITVRHIAEEPVRNMVFDEEFEERAMAIMPQMDEAPMIQMAPPVADQLNELLSPPPVMALPPMPAMAPPMPAMAPPMPAMVPPMPAIVPPMPAMAPPMKMQKEEAIMAFGDIPMFEAEEKEWVNDLIIPLPPVTLVREYAHKSPKMIGVRSDFAETLYWNACVRTDENGIANVEFDMNDSVTGFKFIVDAFSDSCLLGTAEKLLKSTEPFYLEPKMPLEVTGGDLVRLPIALVNSTNDKYEGNINITTSGKTLVSNKTSLKFTLNKEERAREMIELKIGSGRENASLTLESTMGPFKDTVIRTTKVVPSGFPFNVSYGGILDANSKIQHKFSISDAYVARSSITTLKLLPSPASSLIQALESLIREPYGCFEQTSMTTYPLVMALHYFKSHPETNPKLIERANEQLEKGYKRLAGYECKQGGFEWFGSDPGHEALTAYGLMQFSEMETVLPFVDKKMIERTKKWLLDRRDKEQGGYKRNPKALDSFGGAPPDVTNAYITWGLAEAEIDIKDEIEHSLKKSKSKNYSDLYVAGLVCATLFRIGRKNEALEIAQILANKQKENGGVADEETTITRSGGESKVIESTSIAVLCWLNDSKFLFNAGNGVKYLQGKCSGGFFGSTQGTVLALKAIVAYDKTALSTLKEGSVIAKIDGEEVSSIGWSKVESNSLDFPSFADKITPGNHVIELEMLEGNKMPYILLIEYNGIKGISSEECIVDFHVSLASSTIKEGEGTEINVSLSNKTDKGQPMTVAIIGLPGGLELRHEKLKEMVKSGDIDFYETMGRQLVLYWRCLKPSDKRNLKVDVLAAVPGKYTGPASRAYLYYTAEHKVWISGLETEVVAK